MNLSHAYGTPPSFQNAERLLLSALDLGITHFDSAALYGFGRNEELLGRVLPPYRERILLTSKGGLTGIEGKRVIDGRPESILRDCEASLKRLRTDAIDLYYLHRWDQTVPIEDSVGALSLLVEQGKIRTIGLSEVSAATLTKAHAVHPVTAVQSEYSLWTREPEVAVLEACRQLNIAFIAFSPLARGFLADLDLAPDRFVARDIRRNMPRFQPEHFAANRRLQAGFGSIAEEVGCSPAQLALAWVLGQGDFVHAIPGTTSPQHLEQNFAAAALRLAPGIRKRLDALINPRSVSGARYPASTQSEIDTEEIVSAHIETEGD